MRIFDESQLLSKEEHQAYLTLLKTYGYKPHHFILEVREDQSMIDMNDLQYVIIVKVQATCIKSKKSKTYLSKIGLGTWLTEFEEDLKNKYF